MPPGHTRCWACRCPWLGAMLRTQMPPRLGARGRRREVKQTSAQVAALRARVETLTAVCAHGCGQNQCTRVYRCHTCAYTHTFIYETWWPLWFSL